MSRPDAAASAALDEDIIKPVWLGYLDIVGDPVRSNTSGADLTPVGTGDPDLDGLLFSGISARFIDISPVKIGGGGSETVTASLSGLAVIDEDTLDLIADPTNWQGRVARLWRIIRNAANVQQGAIQHYYTGYMTALDIQSEPSGEGSPGSQTIRITIESYLVAFSQASNRTYLDQQRYDSGDLSAKAAIAIANGNTGNPLTGNTPIPGSGVLPTGNIGAGGGRRGRVVNL